MKNVFLVPIIALAALAGCGRASQDHPRAASAKQLTAEADLAPKDEVHAAAGAVGEPAKPAVAMPRKVTRKGEVKIIVDDFDKAQQDFKKLVKEMVEPDGYVGQQEISGSAGSRRSGRWVVRVPVSQFETFQEAVGKLGIPEKNSIDTRDVTEEYYDIQADLKNKKREEEAIARLLDNKNLAGSTEDILKISRQLGAVRGEINRLETRLRRINDQVDLTTVTVMIEEIKNYVPPQSPSFGNRIARTFADSVEALASFGRGLTLVVVALAPWLPLLIVIVAVPWLLIRRALRSRKRVRDVLPAHAEPPSTPHPG